MSDDLKPWHLNYLHGMDYNRVDLVKEGANSKAQILLFKNRGGNTMDLDKILAALQPDHRSVIEKALKEADDKAVAAEDKTKEADAKAKTAEEEVEKLKAQVPVAAGTSEEDILKSVKDPALRSLMETQIAKTKLAEEAVIKMREESLEKESINKAKEVPGIGSDEAALAGVYKKLKTLDAQLCEDVFGIFKAASALVGEGAGAFTPSGTSTAGIATSSHVGKSSAAIWTELETIGKSIVTESNGKTSLAKAVQEAVAKHPEMYAAYTEAQAAGR